MEQEVASRNYDAFLFRQRKNAPLQVAFVAPSSEIDAWARVPTKQTGNIRNFQRAQINSHIKEVQRFFRNVENASPTAVVVGFDPIRSSGHVKAVDAKGDPIDLENISPGKPVLGTIEISWLRDISPETRDDLLAAIAARLPALRGFIFEELRDITGVPPERLHDLAEQLKALSRSGQLSEPPLNLHEDEEEDDSDDSEGLGEDDETEDEPLPESLTSILAGLSPSEMQVVLGRIRFLNNLDVDNLENESEATLRTIYREIRDELKPGILIDGQHRVMGTKELGNIPFLVTALPSAEWPELAFQFIVTNRTAKRVPESLLISIVGNSLSKSQRNDIEARLREANIRVGLIEAVMKVHEDEMSPFYDALAFGLKRERGFLDAAAMRGKVVQLWYERKPPVRELFDHFCEGKRIRDRTDFWKSEELWFSAFIAFWSAVRERYERSSVFSFELSDPVKKTPYSKLMTATVLKIFQETVLGHILEFVQQAAQMTDKPISASIPTTDAFSELVQNTLRNLEPGFFEGWQLSGFDGSKGARDDLAQAIEFVLKGEKTVQKLKDPRKPHRLFQES